MVRQEGIHGFSPVRGRRRQQAEDRLDASKADACPTPLGAVTSSTPGCVHPKAVKLKFGV